MQFTVIPNFFSKEICDAGTELIFRIKENNATIPSTGSAGFHKNGVPQHPYFEYLLEQLTDYVSKVWDVNLVPTYAYARLYTKGEELLLHRDRDACEYSATVTLGYSGEKPWPIYVAKEDDLSDASEFSLNVGDALLYKGIELYHWRQPLEMEWQTQVFLHYVDVNGPYAHHKYDGRECLQHHLFMKQEGNA